MSASLSTSVMSSLSTSLSEVTLVDYSSLSPDVLALMCLNMEPSVLLKLATGNPSVMSLLSNKEWLESYNIQREKSTTYFIEFICDGNLSMVRIPNSKNVAEIIGGYIYCHDRFVTDRETQRYDDSAIVFRMEGSMLLLSQEPIDGVVPISNELAEVPKEISKLTTDDAHPFYCDDNGNKQCIDMSAYKYVCYCVRSSTNPKKRKIDINSIGFCTKSMLRGMHMAYLDEIEHQKIINAERIRNGKRPFGQIPPPVIHRIGDTQPTPIEVLLAEE